MQTFLSAYAVSFAGEISEKPGALTPHNCFLKDTSKSSIDIEYKSPERGCPYCRPLVTVKGLARQPEYINGPLCQKIVLGLKIRVQYQFNALTTARMSEQK